MINKNLLNVLKLRNKVVLLIALYLYTVVNFSLETSIASTAQNWISMAEKASISEENYSVSIETEIFHESIIPKDTSEPNKLISMSKKLIGKANTRFTYTKKRGLRPIPTKTNINKSSSSQSHSFFTLDIGNMLQKMKGKAKWVLENDNIILDKQKCIILRSSGDKWLVRLWVRKKDGSVLRYDQYLNNKFIGTSLIEYKKLKNEKCFPSKASTRFNLTNHIIVQRFYDYSF